MITRLMKEDTKRWTVYCVTKSGLRICTSWYTNHGDVFAISCLLGNRYTVFGSVDKENFA